VTGILLFLIAHEPHHHEVGSTWIFYLGGNTSWEKKISKISKHWIYYRHSTARGLWQECDFLLLLKSHILSWNCMLLRCSNQGIIKSDWSRRKIEKNNNISEPFLWFLPCFKQKKTFKKLNHWNTGCAFTTTTITTNYYSQKYLFFLWTDSLYARLAAPYLTFFKQKRIKSLGPVRCNSSLSGSKMKKIQEQKTPPHNNNNKNIPHWPPIFPPHFTTLTPSYTPP